MRSAVHILFSLLVLLVSLSGPAMKVNAAIWQSSLAAETTVAKEGIYEFTSASGKTYVGQSGDIAARIDQQLPSGKLLEQDLSTLQTTKVLGGKTAREIAEQLRINELGGVQNLENIRNPIGPARQYLLPGKGPP